MKKLLPILVLLISINAYSQSMIGSSFRDVKEMLNDKGYSLSEGYMDKTYYLIGSSNRETLIYYFNSNNVCTAYIYANKTMVYSDYIRTLKNIGYYKSGDFYYKGDLKAEISYDTESKNYFCIITQR